MELVWFSILGYLMGSFPTGLFIGKKYFKKDIRKEGSGNMGGTNAGRILGKKAGIIVSFLDILKVFIPTLLARIYFGKTGVNEYALVGLAAMIGHAFPVFAGFRGGKCVSSYLGIGLLLNPYVAISIFVLWIVLRYVTNYVSVASMVSCLTASITIFFIYGNEPVSYIMLAAALFVVFLHRANIKRIINGTENKVRNKNKQGL